jgi:hypothetical protein
MAGILADEFPSGELYLLEQPLNIDDISRVKAILVTPRAERQPRERDEPTKNSRISRTENAPRPAFGILGLVIRKGCDKD